MITSRQHPLVKTFRRVSRGDAVYALLDGWHLVREAAAAGLGVEQVAVLRGAGGDDAGVLAALPRATAITEVSPAVMAALSPVRTPAGIAAIVRRPTVAIDRVLAPAPALVMVAVSMQDPGNVGAMVRAAEAMGATGVVCAGASADPWGWKALRAAMGSTFRLPVVSGIAADAAARALRAHALQLLAAVPRGGAAMHGVDLRRPTAIVLGSEGAGLPSSLDELMDARVSIPMRGPVESLNVAVAAALLLYEAARQRG